MNRRTAILLTALLAGLAATALAGLHHLNRQRAAALTARGDLLECRRLAADLERLMARPALAADRERLAAETTRLIEAAAKEAGLAPAGLLRIIPAPPQRVGDSVYKEKPTQIILKNATMRQIVGLIHSLAAGQEGLTARSIRLTAVPPQPPAVSELWDAEITVSYLIYDPPQTSKQGA